MFERWMWLWLVASSVVAGFWPSLAPGVVDPFLASRPHLGWLISLAMFAVGCLLPVDELRGLRRQWPLVVYGTAVQYSVMPLLAYGIGRQLIADPSVLIGVIMVGCVPGAMASNVLTLLARGNTSYSVCLTTLATLLSPAAVPILLWLTLGAEHQIDVQKTAWQLLQQVVLPVIVGFSLCQWPSVVERGCRAVAPWLASLSILWIIACVVAENRERLPHVDGTLLIALGLINGLGYAAGYVAGLVARLDVPLRRALTLEIGMQNCGLGTVLVGTLFPDHPTAAIPTAAYTFGCMLTGTLLAQYWSGRPESACPSEAAP
jgi:BASS family bile acid:Na+ symporter